MESPPVRGTSSASPPNSSKNNNTSERSAAPNMTALDKTTSSSASLESSLNRRRNTYAALPNVPSSKSLSSDAQGNGSGAVPRYTNTNRRNTTSGIDWHTPPVSVTNSLERANMATHAASEPRHTTAGRLPLAPSSSTAGGGTALPPVAGSGSTPSSAPSSLSTRAVSAGLVRTNATITRSARLPLNSSTSPTSSAASTPPARRPPLGWMNGGNNNNNSNNAGAAPPTAPPSGNTVPALPPSTASVAGKVERVSLTNGVVNKAGSNSTSTSPSASPATTAGQPSGPPPEAKTINTAIKTFNQRLLEEREKEKARLSRRSSRANSREASMSVLPVPSTQPPSAAPPPPLKTTAPPPAPAAAEPFVKRGSSDSAVVSRTPSSNARTPASSPAGTGTKTTPVNPPPVATTATTSNARTAQSPAASSARSPPRQLYLAPGKPTVPLTVSSSSSDDSSGSSGRNSNSTGAQNKPQSQPSLATTKTTATTSRVSASPSQPRSVQNSAESGVVGSAPRMSLVEQGPRSHLPRTLPTTTTTSTTAAASPATKTSAQPTPVKAPQQTTSPAAATNLKPAMTTFTPPRTTTSTSGSQSARLELGKAPFSQSPPQPPSVRQSGSGTALQVSPRTASTNGSTNRTPNGVNAVAAASLPSRYSDYNDDRTPTPPRAAPLSQAPASPVYSAVEVQAHTPPNSSTTSSRRGVPGLASVFGDTKKDANTVVTGGSAEGSLSLSSRNRSSGSASAPAPPPKKTAPPVLVKSHTLDDLDDAGEDAATPNAQDGGRSSAPGSARAATAAPQTEHGRGQRVSDNTSLDSADGAAGGSARGGARASPLKPQLALTQGGGAGGNKTSSSPRPPPAVTVPASARTAAAAGAPPVTSSPLTALAVFSSTDEPRIVKSSPLTTNKVAPVKATDAGEKKTAPLSNNASAAAAVPSSAASTTTKAHGNGIDSRNTAVSKPTAAAAAASTLAQPPSPTASPPHLNTGSIVTAARSAPQPSTSPPSHGTPAANNTHTPSPQRQQQQQRPGSALTRNGRYAMSRSRDGQAGPLAPDHDDHAVNTSGPQPVDANAEAATLHTYLKEEELNLSMSTFNSVGLSLAHSLNLRVLNLKGSTIASEGLRGLANIATLRSICVSHMRSLTTLIPLVTPTTPGARCSIEEIDAQFSSVGNDGIRDLEKVRRLRRLDLSMTPISDVTCLGGSISLQDLYLTGTRVDSAGVAGLERVPTLTTLNIARTKVTSVCQLAKSRSLQTFIFYSCQVNDAGFAGVAEMPRLATLDVSTTKIEDLSVLRTSRSLKSVKVQWLSLKNCQDIIQERRSQMDAAPPGDSMEWRDTEAGFAGLAAIATLETLDLSFNTLRSVHSLCRSKSLKHLYLKRTRVENSGIGSIAQLGATLETLVITNLTDSLDDEDDEHESEPNASGLLSLIGDIHLLQHLTLLDLSYTDVFDLRLLQNITTLKELVIVETLVTVDGLRGIEKIPSLEVLDVSQTSILSLQFLVGGAPRLRKILARSNRNTCGFVLGQVHKLPALEHLDLSDSVVEDMESVPKKLWRLKELVWRWGERRDNKGLAPSLECWVTSPRLVGLREMPCLTLLDLSSSRVHDLSFLAGAPYLKEVHLRLCKLLRNATVQDLGSLVSLEVLQLSDNTHITDVTFLRGCRKLRELHLNNTRVTTSGLEGVLNLPELKVLNIANTRAEDETMNGGRAAERNRMLEDSTMRDCSAVLDNAATPAQYRVPRRRRVSFVANDGGDTLSKAS